MKFGRGIEQCSLLLSHNAYDACQNFSVNLLGCFSDVLFNNL